MKKGLLVALVVLMAFAILSGCGGSGDDDRFFVGLAFHGLDATPTVLMGHLVAEMDRLGWRYVITNGDLDNNKYIADVEALIQQEPDLIWTRGSEFLVQNIIEMTYFAGIPLVWSSGMPNRFAEYPYLSNAGDPELIRGIPLARWLDNYVANNPGFVPRIGFLVGNLSIDSYGSSHRSLNMRDYLTVDWVDVITAECVPNWMASGAMNITEDWLQRYTINELNTIFCWSDEMSIGVIQALQAAGVNPGDYVLMSYDALPIVWDYIEEGWMQVTSGLDLRRQALNAISIMQMYKDGKADDIPFIQYARSVFLCDESNVAQVKAGNIPESAFFDYVQYVEIEMAKY